MQVYGGSTGEVSCINLALEVSGQIHAQAALTPNNCFRYPLKEG
jgi:hypothetical protein